MIEERPEIQASPKVFWPLAVIGWAVLVYGVVGLLDNAERTHPTRWALWFFGAAIAHDLLLAFLVFVIGRQVARRVPGRGKTYAQAGLIMSSIIVLASMPVLLGFGRNPNDPSTLPNNYWAGLLAVLAAAWAFVAIMALIHGRRHGGHEIGRRGPTS